MAPVTCKCICHCQQDASGDVNRTPELCLACDLCAALNSPKHGLPYVPTVWPKLEPLEPITNAQKDEALQNFVAENGF